MNNVNNMNYTKNMNQSSMNNPNMNNRANYNMPNQNMMNKSPDKRTLMVRIYQLGFAMIEAVLFLDTHPSDSEALCFYNETKEKYNEAMDLYSKYFGPLLASNVSSENYWMWVATPMPWELEGC